MADIKRVPVIQLTEADELADMLRATAVQELMSERVDLIELIAVSSYCGKAFVRGNGCRVIRLNTTLELEASEYVMLLCHELAHHAAGLGQRHSQRWREEYAHLIGRAGGLGLLGAAEVECGVHMALYEPASVFYGWPEHASKRRRRRMQQIEDQRTALCELGMAPGAVVVFRYRRRWRQAEVIRVNRHTVTVGEPGTGMALLRVPFQRIVQVTRTTPRVVTAPAAR